MSGARLPLGMLPGIPRDRDGPVFRAPWEARVFAIAVRLHDLGRFAWPQFSARLAAEFASARERGEPDDGTRYYEHWLRALEALCAGDATASPSGERTPEARSGGADGAPAPVAGRR